MAPTPDRYAAITRHRPASRAEKRKLNRATACALCGKPLGPDRYLFAGRYSAVAVEVIAAHPACAEALAQAITARVLNAASRAQVAAVHFSGQSPALPSRYLITVAAAAARIRPA